MTGISCRRWTRATNCLCALCNIQTTKVGAQTLTVKKLHGQARPSNVDRRQYYQFDRRRSSLSRKASTTVQLS